MKRLATFLLVLLFLFQFSNIALASSCDSTSLNLMKQTWQEFRSIHPFGFQTVGLKHQGDTYVFVISEPADWVSSESLKSLFTDYDGHLILAKQPFGYDGALYDFVGCARLDNTSFKTFESRLFTTLYGTPNKPYYTDLDHPAKHIYFSKTLSALNLPKMLSATWLQEEVITGPGGKDVPFRYLLDSSSDPETDTIYYSKKRGIVVF